MRFRASELAEALTVRSLSADTARLVGPDVWIEGAHFDSREIRPGQLFVPIVAERDGHDFVADALARGASAYLTSRVDVVEREGGSAILVRDTAEALIDTAGWVRTLFPASLVVVGVTGSVGKTTTKDLIAAALAPSRRVVANARSFNNEQGLPVTMINAPVDTQVLVLEMGMRGFGQIADLCRIARPNVGVVTRVGLAHTELVGGIEGVARAKGELVDALPPQGSAVLNADDPRVRAMAARSSAPVVTYGEDPDADVRITNLVLDGRGCATFDLTHREQTAVVALTTPGRHTASNAAAAVAVGVSIGVPLADMARALSVAAVSPHRMHLVRTRSGATLIDDSYNANPTSMRAAIETLASVEARRRVAILGVMAEIEHPASAHVEIADLARSLGIELVAVDTALYGIAPVSLDDAVAAALREGEGSALLVKGSRVAGLDRLVDAIGG